MLILGDAVAARSFHFNPFDALDVGNLKLGDELGRNGLVVLGLSILDLLCELCEALRAIPLNSGGNSCLLLLF